MDTVTIMGVPFNQLSSIFHNTLSRVDWKAGMVQSPRIQAAEDRLEAAWRGAEGGDITLKEFEEVLAEWERASQ